MPSITQWTRGPNTAWLCILLSCAMPTPARADQLQIFTEAWQAARKGDHATFDQFGPALEGYVLYPYWQYEDYRHRRTSVSPAEMAAFLEGHQDWAFTPGLRKSWLKSLGERSRWKAFLEYGDGVRDAELKCYHARARLAIGLTDDLRPEAQRLWTSGKSQPDACDPVFKWLVDTGGVTSGIAWERIRLERLSQNEKRVEPLDERVAINLLSITKTDTITGKRSYAILDLLLGTGIRREELVELNLRDVNILQTRTSTITIRKGKGDKMRVIPLAKPQKESLGAWLKAREGYAREINNEAVFITRLGTRPTGESIRQLVKSKLKQLGIEEKGVSVHSLRHLFASAYNAVNQNDLVGLQAITGHANLSTLGIYTHPTLKRTQENLEKMGVNKNR